MEIPLRITNNRTKPNLQKLLSDSSVRCTPLELRGLGAVTRRAPEEMRSAWCGRPAKSANSLISFTEQNNVKRGWAQGLINKVVSRIMLWIGASR